LSYIHSTLQKKNDEKKKKNLKILEKNEKKINAPK